MANEKHWKLDALLSEDTRQAIAEETQREMLKIDPTSTQEDIQEQFDNMGVSYTEMLIDLARS